MSPPTVHSQSMALLPLILRLPKQLQISLMRRPPLLTSAVVHLLPLISAMLPEQQQSIVLSLSLPARPLLPMDKRISLLTAPMASPSPAILIPSSPLPDFRQTPEQPFV